jgi:hypothetical protein
LVIREFVEATSRLRFRNRSTGGRKHYCFCQLRAAFFRQTIAGDGFKAFELTSLLPKTGFDLHVAKMAE